MKKAVFYHAGCPVCADAEKMVLDYLDSSKVEVELVHLGEEQDKIKAAEDLGVQSVPALVIDNNVYHINYGAGMEDVKN